MIKERDEIIKGIEALSDIKYREFHSGLCPATNNIMGVRVPVLRNYARKLADNNWKENIDNLKEEYYEEVMLQGMILGLAKMSIEELLIYLEKFIPKIDNWAINDTTCSGLKIVNKNREKVLEFLQKYLNSDKEFEIRFAIVMLLDYYLTDDYIDEVIKILDNIKYTEYYYVKMAIAWTFSVAYVKYPEKIMNYLANENGLDKDTYNKTLQKIIESKRVGKREKNKMRKMRKR